MAKCKVCSADFKPLKPLQQVCGISCARRVPIIARNTVKAQKKADKAKLTKMDETLPNLKKKAQAAFNAFIRKRDQGNACICCGLYPERSEWTPGGFWDAGHFRGRGACPELAFDERNVHLQRKRCNTYGWDVTSYRENLKKKIGEEELAELEGPHPPKHYTAADYKDIAVKYRKKLKELNAATDM